MAIVVFSRAATRGRLIAAWWQTKSTSRGNGSLCWTCQVSTGSPTGLFGADCGWWVIKGLIAHQLDESIKVPEWQHTWEGTAGREVTSIQLCSIPETMEGDKFCSPQDTARPRNPEDGILEETYYFLFICYLTKHPWNGANPTLSVSVLTSWPNNLFFHAI